MMSVIAGFIAGYMLSSKNSKPLNLAEILQAWDTIRNSEEFQDIVAGGTMMVGQVMQQGVKGMADLMLPKKRR